MPKIIFILLFSSTLLRAAEPPLEVAEHAEHALSEAYEAGKFLKQVQRKLCAAHDWVALSSYVPKSDGQKYRNVTFAEAENADGEVSAGIASLQTALLEHAESGDHKITYVLPQGDSVDFKWSEIALGENSEKVNIMFSFNCMDDSTFARNVFEGNNSLVDHAIKKTYALKQYRFEERGYLRRAYDATLHRNQHTSLRCEVSASDFINKYMLRSPKGMVNVFILEQISSLADLRKRTTYLFGRANRPNCIVFILDESRVVRAKTNQEIKRYLPGRDPNLFSWS